MHEKLKSLVNNLSENSNRFPDDDYRSQIDLLNEFAVEFDKEMKRTVAKLNGHPMFIDLANSMKLAFQYEGV